MRIAKGAEPNGAGQSVNAVPHPPWGETYSEMRKSEIEVAMA